MHFTVQANEDNEENLKKLLQHDFMVSLKFKTMTTLEKSQNCSKLRTNYGLGSKTFDQMQLKC